MDWETKQWSKRRRARERAKIAAEHLRHSEDVLASLGVTEVDADQNPGNPNRYDINQYRGGPGHIDDVGVIKKRRG